MPPENRLGRRNRGFSDRDWIAFSACTRPPFFCSLSTLRDSFRGRTARQRRLEPIAVRHRLATMMENLAAAFAAARVHVSGTAPEAAVTDVAEISAQPCEGSRRRPIPSSCRLPRSDCHVPTATFRLPRSGASWSSPFCTTNAKPGRPLRRDGTANCGMAGAADHRSIPMGSRTALM